MPASFVTQFEKDIAKLTDNKEIKVVFQSSYGNTERVPRTHIQNSDLYFDNSTSVDFLVQTERGSTIARWSMQEMPACCGIAIMSGLYVNAAYQHKGVGEKATLFAQKIARRLNYKVMLGTSLKNNTHSQDLLKKTKWHELLAFRNRNTGNKIGISAVVL